MSASPELSLATPELLIKAIAIRRAPMEGQEEEQGEEVLCRTPTTEESKLPSGQGSCPPAPRKPTRVLSCKRRLQCADVDRLIVVGRKEMEEMFQHVAKKRRRSLHSTAK